MYMYLYIFFSQRVGKVPTNCRAGNFSSSRLDIFVLRADWASDFRISNFSDFDYPTPTSTLSPSPSPSPSLSPSVIVNQGACTSTSKTRRLLIEQQQQCRPNANAHHNKLTGRKQRLGLNDQSAAQTKLQLRHLRKRVRFYLVRYSAITSSRATYTITPFSSV